MDAALVAVAGVGPVAGAEQERRHARIQRHRLHDRVRSRRIVHVRAWAFVRAQCCVVQLFSRVAVLFVLG